MYKVLVVDDETWVRKGIVHKLKRLELPFDCLKEAGDGNEALKVMAEDVPDVVITDIKMDELLKDYRIIVSHTLVLVKTR